MLQSLICRWPRFMIEMQEVAEKVDASLRDIGFGKLFFKRSNFNKVLLYKEFCQAKLKLILGIFVSFQPSNQFDDLANSPCTPVHFKRKLLDTAILIPVPKDDSISDKMGQLRM